MSRSSIFPYFCSRPHGPESNLLDRTSLEREDLLQSLLFLLLAA
jgi:hypothetical protein